ncbi:MAG: RNA methyltransferase [Flavobacteriales bacterium]|nr:RNA methyltransferase [Flavobacteriales bacterium]
MAIGDRKLTMEEIARAARGTAARAALPRITLVLDHIRSGHNVGAIFRTADAFGAERIVLCGYTPGPPDREVLKTALGATETVTWERATDTLEAIRGFQGRGYRVVAVEQTSGSVPLVGHERSGGPLALVFGNELKGVQSAVVEACDGALHIPQVGHKHSLNVSVCAGITLWEVVRTVLV